MSQNLNDNTVKANAPFHVKFAEYYKKNASTSSNLKSVLESILAGNKGDLSRFFNSFVDIADIYQIFSQRERANFYKQTEDFGYLNTYAKTLQPALDWMIDFDKNTLSQAFIDGINSVKIDTPLYLTLLKSDEAFYSKEAFIALLQNDVMFVDADTSLLTADNYTKEVCLQFLITNVPSNYDCILKKIESMDSKSNPSEIFAYAAQRSMEVCFNELILFTPEAATREQRDRIYPIAKRAFVVPGPLKTDFDKPQKLNYPEWLITSHEFESKIKALRSVTPKNTSDAYKAIKELVQNLNDRFDINEHDEPLRNTQFYGEFTYHYLKKIDDAIDSKFKSLGEQEKNEILHLQENIKNIISDMESLNKKTVLWNFIRRNPEIIIGIITAIVVAVLSVFTLGVAVFAIPLICGVVAMSISRYFQNKERNHSVEKIEEILTINGSTINVDDNAASEGATNNKVEEKQRTSSEDSTTEESRSEESRSEDEEGKRFRRRSPSI